MPTINTFNIMIWLSVIKANLPPGPERDKEIQKLIAASTKED